MISSKISKNLTPKYDKEIKNPTKLYGPNGKNKPTSEIPPT